MDFGMPYLLEMSSLEECCALAHELGLSFVELNSNFPACQSDVLDPMKMHQLAKRYGIYFTLHVEEEFDPFSFNSVIRDAWLRSFRRSLTLAVAMHMPIVNIHYPHGIYITLPDRKAYLYDLYHEELCKKLRVFRDMCEDLLSGTETKVSIENTNGWRVAEQRAIAYLLESPVFGLTLDIGHSHGVGNIDEAFFHQHQERLIHMHGHDGAEKRNHLALGDGEIDLRQRFAWARDRHARIVLETKTIEALRTSVARLPSFVV